MKSPIFFQPLEQEIKPVLKYFSGHFLNAGCGNRDITDFLIKNGVRSVTNCDLKTNISQAILCNLEQLPMADEIFDSAFCNAVLEHVVDLEKVMAELRRVLKPGGILVVCIPFLQPYHEGPGDYRRFTQEGMAQFASNNHFEIIEILPVHSMAQSVGWIFWSCLQEKKKKMIQKLFWLFLFLWTRFSQKTNFTLKNNASSYQMVIRKMHNV